MTGTLDRFHTALPLDPSKRRIRVLHLLPGVDEAIRGELYYLDLDDHVKPYTCVSYVWGDTTITEPIWVDGQELNITTNLFDLLQEIRDPHGVKVLWVDSICINQDDIQERSHQVSLMDDVYSYCTSVYIWLGTPRDANSVLIDPFYLFKHFADGKHYHDLPGYSLTDEGLWVFDETHPDFLVLWDAFLLVAENPWWTRAWTVQEVILPTKSAMRLGRWQTTYETISLSRIRRDSQLASCCAQSRAAQPFAIRHKLDHFLGEVARIDLIHYPRLKDNQSAVADIIKSKMAHQLPALYQVILSFAARQCKEPRDKVFSILGLAKGSALGDFKPDYTASIADCYTDFFTRMIEWSGGDHRVLLGSGFGPSIIGMPTWVRNFAHSYSPELIGQEMRRLQMYGLYNCSKSTSGRLDVRNGIELHAKAVQADTVSAVGPVLENLYAGPELVKHVLATWIQLYKQQLKESSEDAAQAHERISRTLCGSLRNDMSIKNVFWRRDTDDDIPSVDAFRRVLDGDFSGLDDGYIPGVAMATAHRALFFTQSGGIGLCNPQTQPGDAVWALIGARVPFILREVGTGQNTHQFIGDCFLLGAMDGEVLKAGKAEEHIILV